MERMNFKALRYVNVGIVLDCVSLGCAGAGQGYTMKYAIHVEPTECEARNTDKFTNQFVFHNNYYEHILILILTHASVCWKFFFRCATEVGIRGRNEQSQR